MTFTLEKLIREASTELGSDACRKGDHRWESVGGRSCPKDYTDHCSQGVYECTTCSQVDYGEPGGPGHHDCQHFCRHKP